MRHYGECEWVTGVVLYEHKGKGNRNKTKKETGDLLGEILGPWIPPEGKKRKKKILKKKVPPRSVAVKKERDEKYIYISKKNRKIRINMKP